VSIAVTASLACRPDADPGTKGVDSAATSARSSTPSAPPSTPSQALSMQGACDGSAAVMVDGTRVLVANDEDNVLRVYDASRGGAPTATFDLTPLLRLPEAGREADIEGAAA
jgi:hypothetical protein